MKTWWNKWRKQRDQGRRPVGRRLGFDCLERRELMAGNVWAGVQQGVLKVTGDDQANSVAIYQDANCRADQFLIVGQGGTLVNGQSAKLKVGGVTQGVQAVLNGGNDQLWVGQQTPRVTTIPGPVGLGADLGGGNDIVHLWNVSVANSCGISGGAGDDRVYVDKSKFAWDLIIDTAGGNDIVSVGSKSTAAHYLMVGTGAGTDQLYLDTAGAAWIYVQMGDGSDYLSVRLSSSALPPGFDGGGGGNDRLWHYQNVFPVPYPYYGGPYCINWEWIS